MVKITSWRCGIPPISWTPDYVEMHFWMQRQIGCAMPNGIGEPLSGKVLVPATTSVP